METALIVSNIILWLVVIGLLLIVFALTRQIGVLHERVAPVGALMPMNGPKIGETVEPMKLTSLHGTPVNLFLPGTRKTLLYFLSPGCPICKSLLPVVQDIASAESNLVDVIYASDGDDEGIHKTYAAEHRISGGQYVLSQELGMRLGVNKLPFTALIDENGVLRGRGLVNSREHIESLLTADELDVSSLQEYLGEQKN